MARFISRLVRDYKEDTLTVIFNVKEIHLTSNTGSATMEGIVLEWNRGDTSERSPKLGNIDFSGPNRKLDCDHSFIKSSVFYRKNAAGPPQYLEKKAILKVFASFSNPPIAGAKYPMSLGEAALDLRTFIGKNAEPTSFPLTIAGVHMGQVSCQITILP